jgi:hypothetical protein
MLTISYPLQSEKRLLLAVTDLGYLTESAIIHTF